MGIEGIFWTQKSQRANTVLGVIFLKCRGHLEVDGRLG